MFYSVAVSKADKKTSITSARDKIDNNNNDTKKEIKNWQSSVIISKPNYNYYQNIHSISSNSNYQAKKKNGLNMQTLIREKFYSISIS